jgi:hypothetical protein
MQLQNELDNIKYVGAHGYCHYGKIESKSNYYKGKEDTYQPFKAFYHKIFPKDKQAL